METATIPPTSSTTTSTTTTTFITNEDYGSRSYRAFNRGNKLKRRVPEPSLVTEKPQLWSCIKADEELEFGNLGKKRAIMGPTKHKTHQHSQQHHQNIHAGYEDEDPFSNVQIEDIWLMPEKLEDIPQNPALVYTLRNRRLKLLSQSAMEMVERESRFCQSLHQLLDLVSMDDPLAQNVLFDEVVPKDLLTLTKDLLLENLSCSTEYMNRMHDIRSSLNEAYADKKRLAKKLVPFPKDAPPS